MIIVAFALSCMGGASREAGDSAQRDTISAQEKLPELVLAASAGDACISVALAIAKLKPVRQGSPAISIPSIGRQDGDVPNLRLTAARTSRPRLVGVVELRL